MLPDQGAEGSKPVRCRCFELEAGGGTSTSGQWRVLRAKSEVLTWAGAAEGVRRRGVGRREAAVAVAAAEQLSQVRGRVQVHAMLYLAQHQLERIPCHEQLPTCSVAASGPANRLKFGILEASSLQLPQRWPLSYQNRTETEKDGNNLHPWWY